MNEFEKEAFKKLSDKEKEEVAGGTTLDANVDLTDEQCSKLRDNLRLDDVLHPVCKYGMIIPKMDPKILSEVTKKYTDKSKKE